MKARPHSYRILSALVGAGLAVPMRAEARPDDGTGLFTFDAADTLESWDVPGGDVRVHYSVDGPSVTLLDDDDGDGVPDFPAMVGREVAEVLVAFESAGFRTPVRESEVGLDPLGGSDALDVYLVDFGGSSDGQFSVDRCRSGVCAGHLLIENDFSGYGYASLAEAAEVLSSHELFHGVQYAYTDDLDPWFSEGTATWAEHLYVPEVQDYVRFCRAYLADVGRSIDRPPAGTVTSFSYGTALFFGFVQETEGTDVVVGMFDALAEAGDGDEVAAIDASLQAAGTGLSDIWHTFATWNLATGPRRGGMDSYPYAAALGPGITPESSGSAIIDDHRFYPLAATYFMLEHPGGELFLGMGEDNNATVVFSVFPSEDGSEDGAVLPPILTWSPEAQATESLGTQPEGVYWLLGSYPQIAPESEKRVFCFGDASAMESCAIEDTEAEDTGTGPAVDTGEAGGTAPTEPADEGEKRACSVGPVTGSLGFLWILGVGLARRQS